MTHNEPKAADIDWAAHISSLLQELSSLQDEVLEVLDLKRQAMLDQDHDALQRLHHREGSLGTKLAECHQKRLDLLALADSAGLAADSIGSLASQVTQRNDGDLTRRVKHTSQQMRLLQHSSLTNWVVTQRTLIHLSQMLEIIASGGRLIPTYGDTSAGLPGGALVNQEI